MTPQEIHLESCVSRADAFPKFAILLTSRALLVTARDGTPFPRHRARPMLMREIFAQRTSMSECERESELLARCVRDDTSGEIYRQEHKVAQTESEERCLRRAVGIMLALAGFAVVGAGHLLIVFKNLNPYQVNLIFHGFRILGVASILCLIVFGVLWLRRRRELQEERARHRSLIQDFLKARASRQVPTILSTRMN